MERRLAAIMLIDMVGYSRLMEADETNTIARQKTHRKDLIDPTLARHNGRIVKSMGDGLLVEFASIVDAMECAIEIQRSMPQRETGVPDAHRICYRIGVNLGDIIIDGRDILGDGVNLAARLEGIAEPGGICIPDKVFREVRNKLDVGYAFLGEQHLKNIEVAVPVYRVVLEADAAGKLIDEQSTSRARWWLRAIPLIFVLLLAAAGAAAIWIYLPLDPAQSTPERQLLPVANGNHSIAVMAFQNQSSDRDQDYFADGIAEDVITDLSKISKLFVTARNSSFFYKGKSASVERIGRELGVRYVLHGSVRKAGDKVRISAQLVDTRTGGQLWAERYDGRLDDVFALQDRVTARIIKALSLTLGTDEASKLVDHGTSNVRAYDAFLKGQQLSRRSTSQDRTRAVEFYRQALALDPNFSRASAALATLLYKVWRDDMVLDKRIGIPFPARAVQAAKQYAKQALKRPNASAHIAQALLLQPSRKYDEAIRHAEAAIDLDPNKADGYIALGQLLVFAGVPERAIRQFEKARQLDPHNVETINQGLGLASFGLERFEDAARHLERARDAAPDNNLNWMYLAAVYAHLGRTEVAKAAAKRMDTLRSEQGLHSFRTDMLLLWYFKDKKDENRLKAGLLKAGIPRSFY